MRGTPPLCSLLRVSAGIIPAYAGNTSRNKGSPFARRDHPRVCGEHIVTGGNTTQPTGSSPRMRGTHPEEHTKRHAERIIPAYAGTTLNTRLRVRPPRDHPRVCGEHALLYVGSLSVMGSSPRMRGTRARNGVGKLVPGIIPAYAGNTPRSSRATTRRGDHPRVCGEHVNWQSFAVRQWGSSPRMRGTPVTCPHEHAGSRIIPAYAGNTLGTSRPRRSTRDHPRVCGEHASGAPCAEALRGSSPRMRGTLRPQGRDAAGPGIIPAYAGNTIRALKSHLIQKDHPRVCGEHTKRL